MRNSLLLIGCLAACAGGSKEAATSSRGSAAPDDSSSERVDLGTISVAVPRDWSSQPPSSKMRAAQWQLSGAGEQANLVVYHFGPGAGGSVDANLKRWFQQFEQPDGSPSSEVAEVDRQNVNGVPVTTVDVSGRYVAETRPGSGQRLDEPDWRMLAAVVEAPHGWYYVKLVGHAALVDEHADRFASFVASIRLDDPRSGSR